MASTPNAGGHGPSGAEPKLTLPPGWDAWLGKILPVAIPQAEQYIEDLVKKRMADFSAQHPGKSFWEVFGETIASKLQDKTLRQEIFDKLHLSGFIAKVSNFSQRLLDLIATDPNLSSIKDAAEKLDTKRIAAQLADGALETAQTVRRELFQADPTAALTGIVKADKVTLSSDHPAVKEHTVALLSGMSSTDMATKSPHTLLKKHPALLASIPPEHREPVVNNLTTLARTQTIARSPPALEAMVNNGLTSAVAVVNTPINNLKAIMTHDDAVYAKSMANKVVLQNQMFLSSLMDHVKTQAPGSVGPSDGRDARKLQIQQALQTRGLHANLDDLFGAANQAEADENTTVYSPASYFVDLLMYLRNNNLDPEKVSPNTSTAGQDDDIRGTALDLLFRRRPDLKDLELTAANTTVQLPYIDLANEVMESFIVHLPDYFKDAGGQTIIDTFNVTSQESDELLAQPQNVKMDAYCTLAAAVYPPTLPYHQPLDAQRSFLRFLGTSRSELVNTFRPKASLKALKVTPSRTSASTAGEEPPVDPATTLEKAQRRALNAQYYCEVLDMVQEEFLILTKGIFWEKDFFELTLGLPPLDPDHYQRRVGLRSVQQCWGYATVDEMLSTDRDPTTGRRGLSFVKQQLLRRSGLSYTELLDVITTAFINPNRPLGRDKAIFSSLRYSYKFLQELVDEKGPAQYDRVAQFVASHTSELNLTAQPQSSKTGQAASSHQATPISTDEMKAWIPKNFKRIGQVIVIDSEQGARLKVTGKIIARNPSATSLPALTSGMAEITSDGRILQRPNTEFSQAPVGTLMDDGSITDASGNKMGQVGLNYRVYYQNPLNDNDFNSIFPTLQFSIQDQPSWTISAGRLVELSDDASSPARDDGYNKLWVLDENMGGSGDIENARLVHLDGSPLSTVEWDRLHRFIRLWKKLGWSTTDTDRACTSLLYTAATNPERQTNGSDPNDDPIITNGDVPPPFDYEKPVNFDDFADGLSDADAGSDSAPSAPDITYELIEQLAALKQILALTNMTLEQLLTIYSTMTSDGPKSQYHRLFLRRQTPGQNPAFLADSTGTYFTSDKGTTITSQVSTVMAALSMKREDIFFLMQPHDCVPDSWIVPDLLTMSNLSKLYAYGLIAKTFAAKISDVFQIMLGFGSPFKSPSAFLMVLQKWSKMSEAAFPWQELRYVVDQIPTPTDPLALTEVDSLRVSKTLRDSIVDLRNTYPLDLPRDKQTLEYTQTVAAVILPSQVLASIIGLLGGSTVYSTSAPTVSDAGFGATVSKCTSQNIVYVKPKMQGTEQPDCLLQVTGILSMKDKATLKATIRGAKLSDKDGTADAVKQAWEDAVDRVGQKPFSTFPGIMSGILPDSVIDDELGGADRILLAPDPPTANTAAQPSSPTVANPKVVHFLKYFMQFLQTKLTYQVVLDTISTATGFKDSSIANTFLENVISTPTSTPSIVDWSSSRLMGEKKEQSMMEYILQTLNDSITMWQGYLSFEVEGDYIFSISSKTQPDPLILTPSIADGNGGDTGVSGASIDVSKPKIHPFKRSLDGQPGLWVTDRITIELKNKYSISIRTDDKGKLCWQTASIPVHLIPAEQFVPTWRGYLRLPTTDVYAFSAKNLNVPAGAGSPKAEFTLDHQTRPWGRPLETDTGRIFPLQGNAPETRLDASRLHPLELVGMSPDQVLWKTGTSLPTSIPVSCFLPSVVQKQTYAVFTKLQKLALFLNHFSLSSEEILYIHQNSATFSKLPEVESTADTIPDIDFDGIHSLSECTRLYDYTRLRDSLPRNNQWSLVQLFAWASQHPTSSGDQLAQKISFATSWPQKQVLVLLGNSNFAAGTLGLASEFCNERLLIRMQRQLEMARKLDVSLTTLFTWASPLGTAPKDFNAYDVASQSIQRSARARFPPDDWTKAVRPINNTLRGKQSAALVSYLLTQQRFVRQNDIVDADGLFEFFLIDVQMKPLVETSRIIQAISTVQLFVQRCLLGLEEPTVQTRVLDRQRWSWMQNFRVWQANRQIFLYPENWIVPSLRDNKTESFQQLESELLQKNLSKSAIDVAIRNYVFSLAAMSNLEAIGLYVEPSGDQKVHIFTRTRTSPFKFFYNYFTPTGQQTGQWNGWKDMQIEIPAVVDPKTSVTGVYIAPLVFDGRLLVFIPEITQRSVSRSLVGAEYTAMKPGNSAPQKAWEIKMSWTEYRDGSWIARQTCPQTFLDEPDIDPVTTFPNEPRDITTYLFVPAILWKQGTVDTGSALDQSPSGAAVHLAASGSPPKVLAGWSFDGSQLSFIDKDTAQSVSLKIADSGARTFQILNAETVKHTVTPQPTEPNGPPGPAPVVQPADPKDPKASEVPATTITIAQPAALFSLQGSNRAPPNASDSSKPAIWLDGTSQHIEDADYLSLHTSTPNFEVTAINAGGPSIVPIAVPASAGIAELRDASQRFYHDFIHQLVQTAASGTAISALFDVIGSVGQGANVQTFNKPVFDFCEAFGCKISGHAMGATDPKSTPTTGTNSSQSLQTLQGSILFDERSKLYSLYNWELGMHACMAIVDSLYKAQQFEQARDMCHYVFDPYALGDKNDPSRYWKFPPFKVASVASIESLFLELEGGKPDDAINAWRKQPFQPHVIARGRPQAYMKWIVMTYIKILIGWGDSLFQLNTLESIPQAIQMYVMASHIYGPRGQVIPRRSDIAPQTFRSLVRKFDAFSNAMVQLEEVFPFSNQTALPVGKLPNDDDDLLPNVFGFAGTLYFAIPDNPSIRQLAATIDDRLLKIRSSEDIRGNFRILPLLAPPIDPGLLVQAQAQGLSLSSILQDLQGPLPNCKFHFLLQKSLEIVADVKAFGQSLISIRERHDAEVLAAMRQKQEANLQKTVMDMKSMALKDAQNALSVLTYNRTAAVSRLTHWFKLVGNDVSGVPALDQDFQELDAKIATPITSGGLGISQLEQEFLDQTTASQNMNIAAGAIQTAIGYLNVLPNFTFNTQPLGMGESMTVGPANVAAAQETMAKGLGLRGQWLQGQAGLASATGSYQRALQERILQANTAGYEISTIDKQIAGANVRIELATKDMELQQQQIDNAQQLSDFLTQKYSSADLYSWMDGMTKTLYYQTYSAAFALAQRVEKAFKYERPQHANDTYIQSGYWDGSTNGLFAGESLGLSLKQLEAAYIDERGYDYEITKSISLRTLDPLKLIQLRETGACDFTLDEILFDMDFPGHYLRRIKSVSLTIPCVVGPYTSVNATLRLMSSEYRTTPTVGQSYAKVVSETDPRFSSTTAPITSIAVSSAQGDAGVFSLDFSDSATRYLPFEGAGAISKWTLALPQAVHQFNYDSIYDVVLQVRYTALDGGPQLQDVAQKEVGRYMQRVEDYAAAAGMVAIFDVKNEFASEWARATLSPTTTTTTTTASIPLGNLRTRLPFFTTKKSVTVAKLHLLVDQELPVADLTVDISSSSSSSGAGAGAVASGPQQPDTVQFTPADLQDVLPLHHYVSEAVTVQFGSLWVLQLRASSASGIGSGSSGGDGAGGTGGKSSGGPGAIRDRLAAATKCFLLVEYVATDTKHT